MTETDLINMRITAEAGLNNSSIIKTLIDEDVLSRKKEKMAEGERYYVGEHDILNKDFRNSYLSSTVESPEGTERSGMRFSETQTEATSIMLTPSMQYWWIKRPHTLWEGRRRLLLTARKGARS